MILQLKILSNVGLLILGKFGKVSSPSSRSQLCLPFPLKWWILCLSLYRYVLNLKKLPYHTIYVDFEDVDRVIKEAGIPSSRLGSDGNPFHTVPSIIDNTTGQAKAVTDSYAIAEYLDAQYPNTPQAFPNGTQALQAVFYRFINEQIGDLAAIFLPNVPNLLSKESSLEYYTRTRTAKWGKSLEEAVPKGEELEKIWKRLKALFNDLESWYAKSEGAFLVGDDPSFGDFTLAGFLQAFKIIQGEESEDWKNIGAMNDGRWVKLLRDLEKYASVEN